MSEYNKLLDNIYDNLPKKAVSDQRFEFPEFDSFVEGNKTIIKNFEYVASTLRREKNFLVKFLSRELATPITVDGTRVILQRKVNPTILGKKLDEFVKDYIICKICGKPDTNIVSTGSVKEIVCEACGARRPVK